MSSYAARVDALEQTWSEWARIGSELTEPDWRRPTRCAPWQVAQLYAHHSSFPVVLASPTTTDQSATPINAADVLRRFNAPGGEAHTMAPAVAERAATVSAEHPPAELVERFTSTGPRAIATLRSADPAQPMPWVDNVVTLAEAVRIAVLEATVHLLDLERALDRTPTVPDIALRETARLLAEIARYRVHRVGDRPGACNATVARHPLIGGLQNSSRTSSVPVGFSTAGECAAFGMTA